MVSDAPSSTHLLELTAETETGAARLRVPVRELVVAGWTGRDRAAMEAHVRELESLGVRRPPSMPVYYRVAAARLTTASRIQVSGDKSSGEIELVLIGGPDRTYVTVGSDHTDREVETYGVTASKQMCEKPVGGLAWLLEEVRPHWDELVLRAWIVAEGDRTLYQEGHAGAILPPEELLRGYHGSDEPAEGMVIFGGTLPALGGIRPASRFEGELEDPVRGRSIRFGYDVETLPVAG